jgi:hypothetical protein
MIVHNGGGVCTGPILSSPGPLRLVDFNCNDIKILFLKLDEIFLFFMRLG